MFASIQHSARPHVQTCTPLHCSSGDLFHALDNYLKTNKVRFADLFQEYDTDRSGSLEGPEISRLVRKLLPQVNEHELRYFWAMMDTNGDGSITQQEFLSAARECLDAEKAAAARQRELTDTLNHIAAFLRKEQVGQMMSHMVHLHLMPDKTGLRWAQVYMGKIRTAIRTCQAILKRRAGHSKLCCTWVLELVSTC
jgi:hypothetical protein